MTPALLLLVACNSPAADPPAPEEAPMAAPMSTAELHARNLRFRDNKTLFNDSARWLDGHRDEALPAMEALLRAEDPAAIGIARVLGVMADPRAVPVLEATLASGDDPLAYEAARALSRVPGPDAEAALRRGAASEAVGVARNALRGIRERKDAALCDAVAARLSDPDPVGTEARAVAEALGCR